MLGSTLCMCMYRERQRDDGDGIRAVSHGQYPRKDLMEHQISTGMGNFLAGQCLAGPTREGGDFTAKGKWSVRDLAMTGYLMGHGPTR